MTPPAAMPGSTSVLFVCLGNICRSPAAEGVFLHLLARQGLEREVHVDSAGTGGWHVGRPADARMAAAAARRGISLRSRARQLSAADLCRFDHILTMDADNLREVRRMAARHPASASIEPMMRYAEHTGVLEVPDPYYGGEAGFEEVLDLLEEACSGLLQAMQGSPGSGKPG